MSIDDYTDSGGRIEDDVIDIAREKAQKLSRQQPGKTVYLQLTSNKTPEPTCDEEFVMTEAAKTGAKVVTFRDGSQIGFCYPT